MVKTPSIYTKAISAGIALLSLSSSQAFTATTSPSHPTTVIQGRRDGVDNTSSSFRRINHQLFAQNNGGGPSPEFLQKMGVKEPTDIERVRVSIISVEEALQMYRDAKSAEEREQLLIPLREKMMEAAMGTNNAAQPSVTAATAVAENVPKVPVAKDMPKIETAEVPPPPPPVASVAAVPKEEATATSVSSSKPPSSTPNDIESLEDVNEKLGLAALRMDAQTVTSLLESNPGLQMDEETTNSAFWAVVNAVDKAEARDEPLPATVPQMLHHIFDADLQHLLTREKITKNVTCMMPQTEGLTTHGLNYVFDDGEHKNLPLEEGRRCEDGNCCDACSRNIFPTFAQDQEINFDTFPGLQSLTFNDLETVSAATILQFMRLIERVRRTMAHEYGLELKTLLPLQAYSRKYVAGTTQKGGGGGEGDFVTLHTDEATHSGYHYSCVLYMNTQGEDFQGG